MLREHAARLVGVALERGVEQGAVFGMHVARHGGLTQRQVAIALGLVVQDGHEVLDPARRAGRDQDLVEHAVALFPLLAIFAAGELFLGAGQAVEGRHQVRFPGLVATGDRLAQGLAFEHHTGLGDVGKVFERHGRDPEPALALGDDEGVGNQQGQSLAQRGAADAVVVLHVLDTQLFARRQAALYDVPAQVPVGGLDEGLGRGRRSFSSAGAMGRARVHGGVEYRVRGSRNGRMPYASTHRRHSINLDIAKVSRQNDAVAKLARLVVQ